MCRITAMQGLWASKRDDWTLPARMSSLWWAACQVQKGSSPRTQINRESLIRPENATTSIQIHNRHAAICRAIRRSLLFKPWQWLRAWIPSPKASPPSLSIPVPLSPQILSFCVVAILFFLLHIHFLLSLFSFYLSFLHYKCLHSSYIILPHRIRLSHNYPTRPPLPYYISRVALADPPLWTSRPPSSRQTLK